MGRARAFALTWVSYATYYFARKNFPVAKGTIQRQLGVSTAQLAVIDTGYLATYAVGQFAGGWLGDRIGSRRLVGLGMIASALLICAFGGSSTAFLFALFFGLNGFVQATGWPGNVKAMAAWYGPTERGAVMGFWSTCFQVGPLAATAIAAWLLRHFGWRAAFFGPAVWVALVGLLVLLFLQEGPDQGASGPVRDRAASAKAASAALRNPMVWLLGTSYFGMKLIRYCIDFWLPFYLERSLHYAADTAAYVSTSFQFGGIFGAIAIGWISDRWFPGRRGAIAAICTLALALSLALYGRVAGVGLWTNFAAMALVGFCLFGPDSLISGVAAQDLGGPQAAATVAGFINGCGSVGAIAQGALVAGVSARFGWQAVFQVLMLLAVLSSIALGAVWKLGLQEQRQGATA
ncbi:MAG TPA: MFS transporter [Myxococcales bacterium]|jgi:sugar phosphate permease|nr:MFS transporter [Myxococcales bacterium]